MMREALGAAITSVLWSDDSGCNGAQPMIPKSANAAWRKASRSERGATAHNHVFFCREAIEIALEAGDWPGALHYADLLEQQFRTEPFAFVEYVAARARALAAVGQGKREPALLSQLQQLLRTARASRFTLQIPALEAAIATPGWDGPQS
jgi:hypothetical protein